MPLTIGNCPGGLVLVPPSVTVSITTEGCAAQGIGNGCGLTVGGPSQATKAVDYIEIQSEITGMSAFRVHKSLM